LERVAYHYHFGPVGYHAAPEGTDEGSGGGKLHVLKSLARWLMRATRAVFKTTRSERTIG
jgi:hypothetical protein